MSALPGLLNAKQLTAELNLPSVKHVYRWHDEHGLPAYTVGRTLWFDPVAVAAWLERHRVGDVTPATRHLQRVV